MEQLYEKSPFYINIKAFMYMVYLYIYYLGHLLIMPRWENNYGLFGFIMRILHIMRIVCV